MPEGGLYPLEQRIEAKRRGLGRQKYPFICRIPVTPQECTVLNVFIAWAFAVVMTSVLIYELVLNNHFQGTTVPAHLNLTLLTGHARHTDIL